jgi:ectoine hydroxylase-related dioxygenase (phytanoyl-CoA dioxygenase family)
MKGPYLSPDLYANPELLRLARGLLGEIFLIDSLAIVTALPRAKVQHLHKDHEDLSPGNEVVRALMGAYAVTIAIPLVDLTPETGTTRLFTRSHLRPLREEEFAASLYRARPSRCDGLPVVAPGNAESQRD